MTQPIVIILLTYERTEYAARTIHAACKYLRYPDLRWYIADDGSSQKHIDTIRTTLEFYSDPSYARGISICGSHTIPNGTYGANANRAMEFAHTVSPLTLWLEDDWELTRPLDLYPYAALLMEQEQFGMVRLGYLNIDVAGLSMGYSGHLYWWLNRDSPSGYVFTGHPSLRHKRFHDAYGKYPEGLKPGETELGMAWQYKSNPGPGILYPVAMGEYGPFGHIGEKQSYE